MDTKVYNVIYASLEVYEKILNNPDGIVVEAQGKPPMIIKVSMLPYNHRRKKDG